MNYFNLIGIEEKYNIDKVDLENKYIQLQKNYHPDSLIDSKSSIEPATILDINTAYNTLKDDLNRATFILKSRGFDIGDESQRFSIDANLLDDILTQREIIEELTDQMLINNSLLDVNIRIEEIVEKLSILFSCSNYEKALTLTIELKYLDVLKKTIIKKLK